MFIWLCLVCNVETTAWKDTYADSKKETDITTQLSPQMSSQQHKLTVNFHTST